MSYTAGARGGSQSEGNYNKPAFYILITFLLFTTFIVLIKINVDEIEQVEIESKRVKDSLNNVIYNHIQQIDSLNQEIIYNREILDRHDEKLDENEKKDKDIYDKIIKESADSAYLNILDNLGGRTR